MVEKSTKRPAATIINVADLRQAEKANIIGLCVTVPSGNPYPQFLLDDGSGQVLIRSFNQSIPSGIAPGSAVLVIGRVREEGNGSYLASEIVKPVDLRWLRVRQALFQTKQHQVKEIVAHEPRSSVEEVPEIVEETLASDAPPTRISTKIMNVMRNEDNGAGVSAEDILLRVNDRGAEEVLAQLVREGEIFEVSPSKYKVLE